MRKFLFGLFLPLMIYSQDHKTPEEIQKELVTAEAQFKYAKEMFNPWYAGPLITPSASMMPPGQANIQPYLIIQGNYAAFNQHRHSIPLTHNSYQLQVQVPMQVGVTNTTDFTINLVGAENWQNGRSGGGFGDLYVAYGFSIFKETLNIPKFKFSIGETFPTGKYNHLDSSRLNGIGQGTYATVFSLRAGKLIWWSYPYPMNTRLVFNYTIPTTVHVSGFNFYGGGIGTKGTIRPGNSFTADFGYELSFSQRWVFALDIVYSAQNRTKFHGNSGFNPDGTPASVGSGFNDNLSLAPAIEYNFSDAFEILWGAQFSVYGRNSANFVNGQFSVEYQW